MSQVDTTVAWTLLKHACYPGWARASPWEGPQQSVMTPLYSSSRLSLFVCFNFGPAGCHSHRIVPLSFQDSVEKDRQIRELSDVHESDMQEMDSQLCSTRLQLDSVRAECVRHAVQHATSHGFQCDNGSMRVRQKQQRFRTQPTQYE